MRLLKYFFIGIVFFGCNKGVIDFEDFDATINIDSNIIKKEIYIDSSKPIKIIFYPYFYFDTSVIYPYNFIYKKSNNKIDSMSIGLSPYLKFYYFPYFIKFRKFISGNPIHVAHISNSHIDSILTVGTLSFYYDESNNLVKEKKLNDSVIYKYFNGNLSESIHRDALFKYVYYDSIYLNITAGFFPSKVLDGLADEFDYLEIKGNRNRNLLKYKIKYNLNSLNPVETLNYVWVIDKNKIIELNILKEKKVWQKVKYEY
jgi:hypothetical protein